MAEGKEVYLSSGEGVTPVGLLVTYVTPGVNECVYFCTKVWFC